MSFLQPWMLWVLPAIAVPILIHLIYQHRHRSVEWAAMMFLVRAQRMNKGMARLRYVIIMLMRMVAIAAIIFVATRPLVSGRLSMFGMSKPDATLILLDRSASMETQNLQTGESKRSTSLKKLAELLEKRNYGNQLVLSQLAGLCSSIGDNRQAAALYTHCALLAPSQDVTFNSLIDQASESFTGDDLIELAENMFAVATQDEAAINRMLDLRTAFLSAEVAADRSKTLFADLDDRQSHQIGKAMRGARIFAQAGDYDRATQCLYIARLQHGEALLGIIRTNLPPKLAALSREDLIRAFPEDDGQFNDYSAWLSAAAADNSQFVSSKEVEASIVLEMQLTIALRQCQRGDITDAAESLACVSIDLIERANVHRLLAIDVMREAGLIPQALAIEQWLHERQRLSHLGFGDLLRDTRKVLGEATAIELADQLLAWSLDDDLVEAVMELGSSNTVFQERIATLMEQSKAANDEFASRTAAARERQRQRTEWNKASQP